MLLITATTTTTTITTTTTTTTTTTITITTTRIGLAQSGDPLSQMLLSPAESGWWVSFSHGVDVGRLGLLTSD